MGAGEKRIEWQFAAFGTSTTDDREKNGYVGDAAEGSVRVYSMSGAGKVVPLSMDGVSFYYTKIDPEVNFRIKARAHINSWSFTNGQEAFGVMACDRIGRPGQNDFWNNSIMSVVTKHNYGWDREKGEYSDSGERINMFLGVSALARHGVDRENLGLFETDPERAMKRYFFQDQSPLEHFCAQLGAGFYNIAEECTQVHTFDEKRFGVADYGEGKLISQAQGATPASLMQRDFILEVTRNNSGYLVKYTSADGKWSDQKQYFDRRYYDENGDIRQTPKAGSVLTALDDSCIYAGFFAARNADITFDEIEVETFEPAMDEPTKPHDKAAFDVKAHFTSAPCSGTCEYVIGYRTNWNGYLRISGGSGKVLFDGEVFADRYTYVRTELSEGENRFSALFTPDRGYHYGYDDEHPDNVHNILSSYEAVSSELQVTFRNIPGDAVRVSPDGRSEGAGSVEDPIDIHTAVSFAHPGLKIILAPGTYILDRPLRIERGVDGRENARITLCSDETVRGKAVLDFSGITKGGTLCGALALDGSWWHLENLEVKNTADIQVGVWIAGSNNLVENVIAHNCGNVGICILSRSYEDHRGDEDINGSGLWPHHNRVLGCISYENTDKGRDLADGFACKLLAGEGNVFERCISHHNSDDGFDLYTKSETGAIGGVKLIDCISYKNGYIHENGELISGGNGNGFKLGGEGIACGHILDGCIAYDNKGEGFDSNSCPDIKLYRCLAYDNEKANVHLYGRKGRDTDFYLEDVKSSRSVEGMGDLIENGRNQEPGDIFGPGVRLLGT